MVYTEAARKTGAFMFIAAAMSLGVVTFMTEDLSAPTGQVISPATDVAGSSWLVFALGIFLGSVMITTYFYIAHIEMKRDS